MPWTGAERSCLLSQLRNGGSSAKNWYVLSHTPVRNNLPPFVNYPSIKPTQDLASISHRHRSFSPAFPIPDTAALLQRSYLRDPAATTFPLQTNSSPNRTRHWSASPWAIASTGYITQPARGRWKCPAGFAHRSGHTAACTTRWGHSGTARAAVRGRSADARQALGRRLAVGKLDSRGATATDSADGTLGGAAARRCS